MKRGKGELIRQSPDGTTIVFRVDMNKPQEDGRLTENTSASEVMTAYAKPMRLRDKKRLAIPKDTN